MNNEESIKKEMCDNRALRTKADEGIQSCYNRLEKRKTSIKNIIKYSLIFGGFIVLNTGINIATFGAATPFVVAGTTILLTGVYGAISYSDIKYLWDNKNDDIYEELYAHKGNISNLDTKYIELENTLSVSYNHENKNLIMNNVIEETEELPLCFGEEEPSKQKVLANKKTV